MTDIYTVQSGESLSIISRDVLGDINKWKELAFLNGLSHPYFIYPGQILELPPEKGSEIFEVFNPVAVASIAEKTGFSFSPATVILLAVGAALLFWRK